MRLITSAVTALLLTIATLSTIAQATTVNTVSPYKGQQTRNIKALSQDAIDGYLSGKGMGLAKTAELNHYPGPRHVLDLSEKLELSQSQISQTQSLFNNMQASARTLGKQLVEQEQKLDQLFSQGSINQDSLQVLLLDIGSIQSKLRHVHLNAHLEQKKILNKHQIMMYDRLRGYDGNGPSSHEHHDNHNHAH